MTTILQAALSASVNEAAYKYLEAGCSIIPLHGKKPAGTMAWESYAHQPPMPEQVKAWLKAGTMRNIGLIGGAVSGGLVLLDVDSLEACDEFEATFPSLTDTLTIRSGSGRGRHYYFYTAVIPANAYRKGVELRCSGAYVVAPPSLHPASGEAYTVIKPVDVRRCVSMKLLREWILSRGAPPPLPQRVIPSGIRNASGYGKAALMDQAMSVAAAAEGEGNRTLYMAALKMGSLVASGQLNRNDVEIELERAASALSQRDGIEATRKTIRSGLNTGMGNPRKVS